MELSILEQLPLICLVHNVDKHARTHTHTHTHTRTNTHTPNTTAPPQKQLTTIAGANATQIACVHCISPSHTKLQNCVCTYLRVSCASGHAPPSTSPSATAAPNPQQHAGRCKREHPCTLLHPLPPTLPSPTPAPAPVPTRPLQPKPPAPAPAPC